MDTYDESRFKSFIQPIIQMTLHPHLQFLCQLSSGDDLTVWTGPKGAAVKEVLGLEDKEMIMFQALWAVLNMDTLIENKETGTLKQYLQALGQNWKGELPVYEALLNVCSLNFD